MTEPIINNLIDLLLKSFKSLEVNVPLIDIENIAVFIYRSMENGKRIFHTTRHVFLVCDSDDPIQILAGLYHDVVYYQIDGGLPPHTEFLKSFLQIEQRKFRIRSNPPDELSFKLCCDVFNLSPGQQIQLNNGLNEFLSAVIAVKNLSKFLSLKYLAEIAACIEGTIPFRSKDKNGKSSFDLLEERLINLNEKYDLGFISESIEKTILKAVQLANRDVKNFAFSNTGKFLDNTWSLLPESNAILLKTKLYSVKSYRKALKKMETFLANLDYRNIFHQYHSYPDDLDYNQMSNQARINIEIAKDYLRVKLLTLAIIESLAMLSGGDAPINMFLGDLNTGNPHQYKAKDFLPSVKQARQENNPQVQNLLEKGRNQDTFFDIKNSPISSYVYQTLGKANVEKYYQYAVDLFNHNLSYRKFVEIIDDKVIKDISKACAKVAYTRRDALAQFFDEEK